MNTAVVITKTEPEIKQEAQKVARKLGISLSSLVNAYLKQVVRTRRVEFDLGEEPSEYLVEVMKQAKVNYKQGRHSPVFKTGEEAVKWLEKQGV